MTTDGKGVGPQTYRDSVTVTTVRDYGPLLRDDRDGNYLGPTMGKALQLQPTFTPGPIDRCIGLSYLEALDTDDGSHLVQITEAGEAFLQQIEEIRQEAQRGWRERAVVGGARCQGLTAARPSPQEARSGLSEIPVG